MSERGSLSIFLLILLPFFLIASLLLAEYSYYRFEVSRLRAQEYLYLDQVMSGFHRPLFLEMGLLAVEGMGEEYLSPLEDREVLKDAIIRAMDGHLLVEGIAFAEDLVGDFLKNKLGIEAQVFDVSGLNRELSAILSGESVDIAGFLLKLAGSSAYARLEGISAQELKSLLLEGEFEKISELRPVFVIRPQVRERYQTLLEFARKYDVLDILGSYQLADYAVDYLGYSLTKSERETLHSEFLLTGARERTLRRGLIRAELFGIRLLMNFAEILINPTLREKVQAASFGDPRLFLLEAIVLSAAESSFDVSDIVARRKVPLYKGEAGFQTFTGGTKNYSTGWSYPDYLKVMLMILPQRMYLSRMQQAIEHNFDVDVRDMYTGIYFETDITFEGKYIPFVLGRTLRGGLSFVYEPGIFEY